MSETTLDTFLNGRVTEGGSHWYFLYAAMVKSTIPELLLVLARCVHEP